MTKIPRKFRRQNIVSKRKKAQKDLKAFIKKATEQAQARSREITAVQRLKTTSDFDEDVVLGFKKEEE